MPCVIVLLLRLPAAAVPEEGAPREEGKSTAGMDDTLAIEIGERRKKWVERVPGVKVTVVLMASKEMLGMFPYLADAARELMRDW